MVSYSGSGRGGCLLRVVHRVCLLACGFGLVVPPFDLEVWAHASRVVYTLAVSAQEGFLDKWGTIDGGEVK